MNPKDIKIGLRVRVSPGDHIGLIVGKPEYYTPRAKLVRVKYEQSTKYEYKLDNQLEALPIEEQYPAHGGTFTKPKDGV